MSILTTSDPAMETLWRFLSAFDVAAVAHAREELTPEQKSSIAAFARGGMDEAERQELIPLLAHNTKAIEHLAALLKGGTSETGEE